MSFGQHEGMAKRFSDDFARQVGRRFLAARRALNLEQKDVAAVAGCVPGAVSNYEHGERMLPPEVAARFAAKYRLSTDWFYLGSVASVSFDVAPKLLEEHRLIEMEAFAPEPANDMRPALATDATALTAKRKSGPRKSKVAKDRQQRG